MSLHDDIMNIPHAFDTYPFGRMERVSYVTGHRDARHAAAELAVEADTEIERLKAENAGLRVRLDECNRRINEMTPRKLTKLQVAEFVVDAPNLEAAIRASYNAGHDAGWNAGRERLEHEENDE